MNKKLIALLMALAMIFCLAGCGGAPVQPEATGTPEPTSEPEATPAPEKEPDRYDLAFARFEPDEVVLTINGTEITWEEYFYWIYSIAYQVQQMQEVDWSSDLDGVFTYQSYAQNYAETMLTQYTTVAQKAEELELELSEEEQAEIDAIYAEDVDNFGGGDEDAFAQYLAERHIPLNMYNNMNAVSVNYLNIFEHYFGVMGAELPDADALAYAQDAGYMHAKHILLRTVDDNRNPLSEAEIEASRLKAEELLSQLKGLSGSELEEKFDELMNENSEDGGLALSPGGYYFLPGEMVQPFEDAVAGLEDGAMTPELVESTFGYHIILRLPLNPDDVTDAYYGYTLRYLAASALFDNMSSEWFSSAEVEYTDKFTQLDFNELFAAVESAPDDEPES